MESEDKKDGTIACAESSNRQVSKCSFQGNKSLRSKFTKRTSWKAWNGTAHVVKDHEGVFVELRDVILEPDDKRKPNPVKKTKKLGGHKSAQPHLDNQKEVQISLQPKNSLTAIKMINEAIISRKLRVEINPDGTLSGFETVETKII